MKHYCIEVSHQSGIKRFECESFYDTAREEGMEVENIKDLDLAIEIWGSFEETPEAWKNALKEGKTIRVSDGGEQDWYYAPENFDLEAESMRFLALGLSSLIVIDTPEDARWYAEEYHGHEEIAVRSAAGEILEEMGGR